ncbi:glutathione S-transferase [Ectothiorhodospiraceae bacterium WFHF3C12]|nr:glutathione S-transferase [Ectothiorhodospiraceae bacterium WFHF3C12]
MLLYTCKTAPSPRRARMFIAEKGIEVPMQEIDLRSGEHFSDDFRRKNPYATVPTLELDDGTCISESDAICTYFEALQPEPALMGTDPKSRALVSMWNRRVEFDGYLAVAEGFRNKVSAFKDRAMPGKHPVPQVEALADRGAQRYRDFLEDLDQRLGESEFVAGDSFSLADITAFVTVEFAKGALKIEPGADQANIARWHAAVSSRPSAQA